MPPFLTRGRPLTGQNSSVSARHSDLWPTSGVACFVLSTTFFSGRVLRLVRTFVDRIFDVLFVEDMNFFPSSLNTELGKRLNTIQAPIRDCVLLVPGPLVMIGGLRSSRSDGSLLYRPHLMK